MTDGDVAQKEREEGANNAYAIHQRMVKARAAEVSMWPHQAQAILDMRATVGWRDLGLESFNEWLAQPEIALGVEKAKKLAATLQAYLNRGFDDLERLGRIEWSKVAVTAAAVNEKRVTPKRALSLAERLTKQDLERELANPDKKLDAESEPEKWKCPTCLKVHAEIPEHLRDEDPDDGEPAPPANDEAAVF